MPGGSANSLTLDLSFRNTAGVVANFYKQDRQVQAAIRAVVRNAGELCKDFTQTLAPFDTGFMHDHVRDTYSRKGFAFEVGWLEEDFTGAGLAFYPIYQEFGTVKMAAQPSLYPAYKEVQPIFLADLRDAVRSAIERRGVAGGRAGRSR